MSKAETAIVSDFLCNYGGIEKEVLTIAKNIDCDIYSGIYSPEETYEELKEFKINKILRKKLPKGVNSIYLRWKFGKLNLKGYKNIIILGTNSMAIARKNHKSIWICNSPALYLYGFDCEKDYIKKESKKIGNPIKRFVYKKFLTILKWIDQQDYNSIDCVLVNSKNVEKRVKKAYQHKENVKIVYPPTDIKKFKYLSTGDFYLSTGRLSPGKNVDKIVKAFIEMPDKKLIVVSNGPQRKFLENISKEHKNIEIRGPVSEEELKKLYGKCIATFAVTKVEDFGMIAIESMASGKPVIATNKGGFKETIIANKTGIFINESTPENIIKSVKIMTESKAKKMRRECENRAKEFSEEKFINGIKRNMGK